MAQDAGTTPQAAVAARYRRFADVEAPGRSALYEEWAAGVADDAEMCALLARIPETHRQPPLVFAVSRLLGAPEAAYGVWAAWARGHADDLVAESSARSIQTNEPLRCAALLPALALIEGPIALLEVGASAGLCLYPDRYSYRYRSAGGVVALDPPGGPAEVVLESERVGDAPLRLPHVVWRAGIDLQPRSAADPADRAWITGLVWPGEAGRAERIEAALDVVAADPPLLIEGDATGLIAETAARAPRGATLVVTTPGVLAHVPRAARGPMIAAAQAAGHWITIDDPGLHDRWRSVPREWPGGFALALDGEILAAVDPLGARVVWLLGSGRSRG